MRLIDLSVVTAPGQASDPPHQAPVFEYLSHKDNRERVAGMFGTTVDQLPGGLGWATEKITLTTHTGCHMDAPWHYHPTMDRGAPSATIDQVPLEWCFSDGVKLDFSRWDPTVTVTARDIQAELDRIGYRLKPRDIVLLQSGAAPYFGTAEYMSHGAGFGEEATLCLLDQGVRVVGTDAHTWDKPFPAMAEEFRRTGDRAAIWPGHLAGRFQEYYQMEKLTNLDLLPPFGFKVICFPVKLQACGAGWTRAVAWLPDPCPGCHPPTDERKETP